jgi:hypothetical protein
MAPRHPPRESALRPLSVRFPLPAAVLFFSVLTAWPGAFAQSICGGRLALSLDGRARLSCGRSVKPGEILFREAGEAARLLIGSGRLSRLLGDCDCNGIRDIPSGIDALHFFGRKGRPPFDGVLLSLPKDELSFRDGDILIVKRGEGASLFLPEAWFLEHFQIADGDVNVDAFTLSPSGHRYFSFADDEWGRLPGDPPSPRLIRNGAVLCVDPGGGATVLYTEQVVTLLVAHALDRPVGALNVTGLAYDPLFLRLLFTVNRPADSSATLFIDIDDGVVAPGFEEGSLGLSRDRSAAAISLLTFRATLRARSEPAPEREKGSEGFLAVENHHKPVETERHTSRRRHPEREGIEESFVEGERVTAEFVPQARFVLEPPPLLDGVVQLRETVREFHAAGVELEAFRHQAVPLLDLCECGLRRGIVDEKDRAEFLKPRFDRSEEDFEKPVLGGVVGGEAEAPGYLVPAGKLPLLAGKEGLEIDARKIAKGVPDGQSAERAGKTTEDDALRGMSGVKKEILHIPHDFDAGGKGAIPLEQDELVPVVVAALLRTVPEGARNLVGLLMPRCEETFVAILRGGDEKGVPFSRRGVDGGPEWIEMRLLAGGGPEAGRLHLEKITDVEKSTHRVAHCPTSDKGLGAELPDFGIRRPCWWGRLSGSKNPESAGSKDLLLQHAMKIDDIARAGEVATLKRSAEPQGDTSRSVAQKKPPPGG